MWALSLLFSLLGIQIGSQKIVKVRFGKNKVDLGIEPYDLITLGVSFMWALSSW